MNGTAFTNGIPVLKIPTISFYQAFKQKDRLYDLVADPNQETNLLNNENAKEWNLKLLKALQEVEAPVEEAVRLGIQ